MCSSSIEESAVDVDQRERRPGNRMRRRAALGVRVRERPLRCSRGRYEVAGEIEGVCQACQGGDKYLVGFPLGDLDGAAAILDAGLDSFVEGERPNHLDPGVDIRREPCRALHSPALRELEEATPFDRSRSGEADGSCRRHCQLGMFHQLFVRQQLDPTDERMGAAAADRREMVVGDDRGEQLVVTCSSSMLDGLGHQPLVEKPQGSPSMDLQRSAGVACFELGLRKLGEEGMDTEPAPVLQPRDQEVRMLERCESRARIGLFEHAVAEVGSELAEDRRTQQESPRRLVEGAENLVVQVVGDEAMIAAELTHRVVRVLDAA